MRGLALAVLVASCLAPRAASAQATRAAGEASACLASIPASAFTQVPVHLVSNVDPSSEKVIGSTADLLASMAAERMRAMLGAAPGQLPPGGAAIGWRDLGPGLKVTLHRDGRFTWEPESGEERDAPGASRDLTHAATDSLASALAALRDEGERIYWPEGVTEDRLTVSFHFGWQTISREGKVEPMDTRFAVPVFSAAVPWQSPVVQISMPMPRYPQQHQQVGVTGTVIMRYVVDEQGGVDEKTISDLWVGDAPRPRGESSRYYRAFVRSVGSSVARGRFEPALVGGCPVRQLVQQPFIFDLR